MSEISIDVIGTRAGTGRAGTYFGAALGVAGRTLRTAFRNPGLLLPPLVAPLIFFAVIAGGLGGLADARGFGYPSGYTSFTFVFIMLNAASFAALNAGFGLAQDLESGFSRRLFLAVSRRSAVLVGYAASSLVRVAMSLALLFAVGAAVGVRIGGSGWNVVWLVAMALAYGTAIALWSTGLALRVRSIQGAPAMQVPTLIALFFAPVFAPLPLLTGWIHGVARWNPISYLLQSGRGYVAGAPTDVAIAFTALAGLLAVLVVWAATGLRRAVRAV